MHKPIFHKEQNDIFRKYDHPGMDQLIRKEIPWCHPITAFEVFAGKPWASLFHAGEKNTSSRWSWIVACPSATIEVQQGQVLENGNVTNASLMEALRTHLEDQKNDTQGEEVPPFCSGLAGFIGYEMAAHFEPSLSLPSSPYALPDLGFGRYDAAAVYDRLHKKAFIIGKCPIAVSHLFEALTVENHAVVRQPDDAWSVLESGSNISAEAYADHVTAIRNAILEGDFFQTNLSRRIDVDLNNAPNMLSLYQQLMGVSDASYGALLYHEQGTILSNSPEKFFTLKRRFTGEIDILAEPIKGTIVRHPDPDIDRHHAETLLKSAKDRAENIMIADLLRNDISRIAQTRSVREDAICSLMSLTHVHHLVSRISGTLRSECDICDVLAALFPCGSITGAPKVEAMKAIATYEQSGRGPYCGAIGYIDDRGNADFSVAIRTMMQSAENLERLVIPVGGGITLRSEPQQEYEETVIKAKSFTTLLGIEHGADT